MITASPSIQREDFPAEPQNRKISRRNAMRSIFQVGAGALLGAIVADNKDTIHSLIDPAFLTEEERYALLAITREAQSNLYPEDVKSVPRRLLSMSPGITGIPMRDAEGSPWVISQRTETICHPTINEKEVPVTDFIPLKKGAMANKAKPAKDTAMYPFDFRYDTSNQQPRAIKLTDMSFTEKDAKPAVGLWKGNRFITASSADLSNVPFGNEYTNGILVDINGNIIGLCSAGNIVLPMDEIRAGLNEYMKDKEEQEMQENAF